MAHGILQNLHPEAEVCSAGVRPASEVHPLAVKVMAEIGIDISTHYPKNVSQYLDQSWDYVITVCGGAKEDRRGVNTAAEFPHQSNYPQPYG